MTLWWKVRSEAAGAWRSMRYDLGRRPAEPLSGGPDVTSTGMCTFGGQFDQEPITGVRPARRRTVAVTSLSALAFAGAAGAYLLVMNGLGTHDEPAAADTFAQRPATSVTTTEATARQGLGPGPARVRTQPDEARPTTLRTQVPPVPPKAPITTVPAPERRTSPTKCLCAPPVPTPTAPTASPSPTPSAVRSSPSPSEASSSPSATGGESAVPSDSPQARHRRGHH